MGLRIYRKLILLSIRSQLEYKASFWIALVSYFFTAFADLFVIWILLERFQRILGWSFAEITLLYGVVHIGFALADMLGKGLDNFDTLIKRGEFDKILIKPISPLIQVAASEINLSRLGKLIQATLVLALGLETLHISFFSSEMLLIFAALAGTIALFYGIRIIQATFCFWTTESLEIFNIATYGGLEMAQYPKTIYPKAFGKFFTYVIPFFCVGYMPIATLLGKTDLPWLAAFLFPLGGFALLFLSRQFWQFGIRRYRSAGG